MGFFKSTTVCTLAMLSQANAERALYSATSNFTSCQTSNNPQFETTTFSFSLTPDNSTLALTWGGENSYQGNVSISTTIISNNTQVWSLTLDPCSDFPIPQLCPGTSGALQLSSNVDVTSKLLAKIPDDVYTTSNLDAQVRWYLNNTATNQSFACVEQALTNGVVSSGSGNGTTNSSDASPGGSTGGSSNSTGGGNSSGAQIVLVDWNISIFTVILSTLVVGLML